MIKNNLKIKIKIKIKMKIANKIKNNKLIIILHNINTLIFFLCCFSASIGTINLSTYSLIIRQTTNEEFKYLCRLSLSCRTHQLYRLVLPSLYIELSMVSKSCLLLRELLLHMKLFGSGAKIQQYLL